MRRKFKFCYSEQKDEQRICMSSLLDCKIIFLWWNLLFTIVGKTVLGENVVRKSYNIIGSWKKNVWFGRTEWKTMHLQRTTALEKKCLKKNIIFWMTLLDQFCYVTDNSHRKLINNWHYIGTNNNAESHINCFLKPSPIYLHPVPKASPSVAWTDCCSS